MCSGGPKTCFLKFLTKSESFRILEFFGFFQKFGPKIAFLAPKFDRIFWNDFSRNFLVCRQTIFLGIHEVLRFQWPWNPVKKIGLYFSQILKLFRFGIFSKNVKNGDFGQKSKK